MVMMGVTLHLIARPRLSHMVHAPLARSALFRN